MIVRVCISSGTVTPEAAFSSLQLDLSMEAGVDDITVSWGVSHLDTGELQVSPTPTQVH